MNKKLYMVETVSIFRMRYVVEALEAEHATDEVVMNLCRTEDTDQFVEFSQSHVDECITSVREITATQYLEEFDKDNDYLKDWSVAMKMRNINTIDYKED